MGIVTMKRLTLLAMRADKEKIFNALAKTRSVELKRSADVEACTRVDVLSAREAYADKINRVEESLNYVAEAVTGYNQLYKHNKDVEEVKLPNGSMARPLAEVDFDYFINFDKNVNAIEEQLQSLADLREQINQNNAQITVYNAELDRLKLIANLAHPTSWYCNTDNATVQLMQVNAAQLDKLKTFAGNYELVNLEVLDVADDTALLAVVAHRTETDFFEQAAVYGLVKCGVTCDVLPRVRIEDVRRRLDGLQKKNEELIKSVVGYAAATADWKVYVDYLGLCDAKLSAEGDLTNTDLTFVMEAYYPAEAESKVVNALDGVTANYVLSCFDIGEGEFAPTLVKSSKVVKPFESITNMYSPPAYHEVDPNPVMSVFYFIIFGFMVADIGYGLLLLIAGIAATFVIKQQTGIKTMLQLFGMCGLSAIVVGALFGSMFCYPVYNGIIPAPDAYPMVMMILSLMLGIVHICAGIGCRMAVKIKHKRYLSAWLTDFPWIITFVSLIFAIFNMAMDMAAYDPWANLRLPDVVGQAALYVCLASLAVGVICAGLDSKGILGKVKSSFGSVYGIINYFSDIMSYIRVFGLMLSSALVGSVINDIASMVMNGGGLGYVFAVIVLIVAHVFNLAMGVLSVYIHNGRLQYVEFFGKFYEGEGALFTPFGSGTKYTLVKDGQSLQNN